MEQNNTLPEDIRQQIERAAVDYGETEGYEATAWYHNGKDMEKGFIAGATVWATRYQEVADENTRMRRSLELIAGGHVNPAYVASEVLRQKGGDNGT